jgi:hypothetical protein
LLLDANARAKIWGEYVMLTRLLPVAVHGCSRSILLRCASVILLLPLAGCGLFKTPFAIDAESIDETSPQTAARIRLSPPQIFTREQLINDRLREDGFLTDQLTKSATATLGTSLARDLQTISALSAQLSVSVDPAAKLNFQRQSQLADLQQQIDVVQLQGQLLTLKNQLHALQAGTGAGPAALATAPSTTVTSGTSPSASDARITALQSRVDSALTALASLGNTTRQNAVTGTLEDEFEDRLALRARIREAINANALDDSHDIDGNALYHFQFTATLLPGEHKSQFGIARIRVEPPTLKQDDVDLLYYTWLSTVTNRMNQTLDHRTDRKKGAMSYEMLGPVTGLYDVAHMWLPRDTQKFEILLAVRPGDRFWFEYSSGDYKEHVNILAERLGELGIRRAQCLNAIFNNLVMKDRQPNSGDSKERKFSSFASACALAHDQAKRLTGNQEKQLKADLEKLDEIPIGDLIQFAIDLIQRAPSVETAVFALGDRSLIPEDVKRVAHDELAKFNDGYSSAQRIVKEIYGTCLGPAPDSQKEKCKGYDPENNLKRTYPAPLQFCRALFVDANQEPLDCPSSDLRIGLKAAGLAYPYGADPVLRSQRVSTVASAANALDLAAALSVQVPQSGAGIGAGLGYSRRAAGRVDTIERVPQVFGFAGPIGNQEEPEDQAYEFGWVFGPKLSLDPAGNKLLLRQDARTQQVSADISIPAWWPRANLRVMTAWKGSFAGGGSILDNVRAREGKEEADMSDRGYDSYDLPLRFRRNQAAFDALTVQLARALTAQGFHQARVDMVRPDIIPVCADAANKSLTILIYGIDLWRNPKVFFGGQMVQSNAIAVLPDMTGISATIDTSLVSKAALDKDETLVVWTAHGVAETKLKTIISANCENSAGDNASKTYTASISRISPSQISICDASVNITVTGKKLSRTKGEYYLGTIPATNVKIVKADPVDVRPSVATADGVVTVGPAPAPLKAAKPIAIDLSFRNLIKGQTLKLVANIKPADNSTINPISISIAIDPAPPSKKTTATPHGAPIKLFTSAITAIIPAGDNTGTMRVFLMFPADKTSTIEISATGGEITKAVLADSTAPAVDSDYKKVDDEDPHTVTVTFDNLKQGNNKGLTSVALTMIKVDGLASMPIDVKSSSCDSTPPPAAQPKFFSSPTTTIAPANDSTGTMRVFLAFPASKTSTIEISGTGAEITKAAFSDSTPPANISPATLAGGVVTVNAVTAPSKDANPVAIDLTFRNLLKGQTLMLTGNVKNVKPADTSKFDPNVLSIAVDSVPQPEKTTATTKQ